MWGGLQETLPGVIEGLMKLTLLPGLPRATSHKKTTKFLKQIIVNVSDFHH